MKAQHCSVFFHDSTVNLSVNCNKQGAGTVVVSRKLENNELSTEQSVTPGAFPVLVHSETERSDQDFVGKSERKTVAP